MAFWLGILCAVLLAAVLVLAVRLALIDRDLDRLRRDVRGRLAEDTNVLLSVSSSDRARRALAADVTDQLRLLRRERQRFQQGDQTLKEAVTGVAHDLRTPLTAIRGYLDLMEDQDLTADQRRYLGLIRDRAEHLTALTEELLLSSAAAARALKPEALDLGRELEEALAAYYGAFTARGLHVTADLPEAPVERRLDREALSRVLGNVLSNALKYSGGDLAVTLTAEGRAEFSNAAPGLTAVTAQRLFDRYFTVETGRGSTGLGLAIARELTERMGGSLEARFARGRLTVALFFPA